MNRHRIVIKLGGLGDVLRTTPLLRALRRRWPDDLVTWIAWEECRSLLEGNGFVDRFLPVGAETLHVLEGESFQAVYCLDEDEAATDLAGQLGGRERFGFLRDASGRLGAASPHGDYALRLCRDDELKFRSNRLSYQEVLFRSAGMVFDGEPYVMARDEAARQRAGQFVEKQGRGEGPLIGLNVGASDRIQGKRWPLLRFRELIEILRDREPGTKILLLGGPGEAVAMSELKRWAAASGGDVFHGGSDNELPDFVEKLALCDAVVSADSFGMHVAIGLGVPVVALFGPTSAVEVECYGRGARLTAGKSCSPCYRYACGRNDCMTAIEAGRVFEALRQVMDFPPSPRRGGMEGGGTR